MPDYGDGNFDFIETYERDYLRNAHWAITETGNWEWLSSYLENVDFSSNFRPELVSINNKMIEQDIAGLHSGWSYEMTMGCMHYIARNGYQAFKQKWIRNANKVL